MFNNKIERFSPKYDISYNKNDYRSWYSQYIRPENITLMISGDVNFIYIKKLVIEYFGNWENNSPMPNQRVYNINITNKINMIIYINFKFMFNSKQLYILSRK